MRFLALVLFTPLVGGCTPNNSSPAPVAADPSPPAETVENPQYANWAKFPKGTTVVHRSVTESAGVAEKTVTTIRYTLTDLTAESVVVEMQASTRRYDGLETTNPPEPFTHPKLIPLPPGVRKDDFGKPPKGAERGEETVTAGGAAYPAAWHKSKDRNEAGEVFTTVWSSDAVPGRLVKSVTHTPAVGKTTTIEVVEVKRP